MTTILSIQSQVADATVGNSVAAFAMQRLGARVIALPTTQFGRRPDKGAPGGGPVPAEVMLSMLDGVAAEGGLSRIDAVLTGYMANPDQVLAARAAVDRVRTANPRALIVCDPVIGDADKGLYVRADTAAALAASLAPAADILIPNAFELGHLTGLPTGSLPQVHAAAQTMAPIVLTTSVSEGDRIGVLYVARTGAWLVETPRLPLDAKGAGDLFAAVFTARRVLGQSLVVALEAAVGGVHDVLARTLVEGGDALAVVEAQEKLEHPDSWPTARQFRPT